MEIRNRQYPFVSQDLKQHMSSRNKLLKTARCTAWFTWELAKISGLFTLGTMSKWNCKWPRDNTFRKRYITTSKAIRNCIQRKEITQPVYTGDVKPLVNDFNEFFTTVGASSTETVRSLENENGIFVMPSTNLTPFSDTSCRFVLFPHLRYVK
jgi:hypothetical protein